jgi:cell division protein FtsB
MRRLRWLVDWRVGATLAAAIFVGLLLFVVLDSSSGRHEALEALKAQAAQAIDIREAQSRRIDSLQSQVADLTDQIILLRDQISAMGERPAVDAPARPRPTENTTPTTAKPTPRTTTTTTPPSSTTTTRPPPQCTTVPVLGRCA